MIYAGQTIEIPVTGERVVFQMTAAETDGELVVVEVTVRANGFVAAAHLHPSQTERFDDLDRGAHTASRKSPATTCRHPRSRGGRRSARG